MKLKIIDLLNKIANGEEIPQMVSYKGKKYHIDELEHFYVNDDRKALLEYIFDYLNDFDALMTEIEIIEEDKKIARLNQDNFQCVSNLEISGQNANYFEYGIEDEIRDIVDKINEIIDYLMENKQ